MIDPDPFGSQELVEFAESRPGQPVAQGDR